MNGELEGVREEVVLTYINIPSQHVSGNATENVGILIVALQLL
jgi:hypothetical protein